MDSNAIRCHQIDQEAMMKHVRIFGLLCSVLSAAMLRAWHEAILADDQQQRAEQVSLARLIAVPRRYDGKQVVTIGVLNIEFEGDVLYLSQSDADHVVMLNSLSIKFTSPDFPREKASKYNGKYVSIRGQFKSTGPGVNRVTAGVLVDVEEIYPESEWH